MENVKTDEMQKEENKGIGITEAEREKLEKEFRAKFEKELKMTADERAKAKIGELEAKIEKLSTENKKMATDKKATRLLTEKKLPVEFSEFLSGDDWEKTKENIERFEKTYLLAIDEAVSSRISGSAPMMGETNIDPFVMGFRR